MSTTRLSKEAHYVHPGSPPRPADCPGETATIVRLDQLWSQLPALRRQELLGQLTKILAQRWASLAKETAHD